ncbi:MAG: ATP synthase F1 subunit delta [Deltaproteobacteria bacterium]|nr:ATP synthase F1 subunit delta [Deltaproteobacteria bacterium]
MTVGILGKRYASALLQLAIESNAVERIGRDLSDFAATWKQSRELHAVFENPEFGIEVRRTIIRDIASQAGMNALVKNMLLLLSDRRRMRYILDIVDAYQTMAEERSGRVRADVITATDLPESYFAELEKTLQSIVGKQVRIVRKKDPELIGGVVTRIGDQVFDGSIRNRLIELKDELSNNALTPSAGPE